MSTDRYSILETYQAAHELHELGYHLVPCDYGSKKPLIKWKEADCSHELIDHWLDRYRYLNLAICAGKSGILGLDADSQGAAEWIVEHCPDTPMFATTPRGGIHAYFRAPDDVPPPAQGLFGIKLDVKSRMSLLLASPSWSREHDTRWRWKGDVVPPSELPVLDAKLIRPEPAPKPKSSLPPGRFPAGPIRDVTRWIMRVPSVQGQHGSNGCFKVACKLAGAGFTFEEAMRWLREWNARVPRPPWSDRELEHKLIDAFNRREEIRW